MLISSIRIIFECSVFFGRRYFGSIQEDRHKVEQFHFLWNSSTKSGTASQKCGTAPPKSGTGTINSDESHTLHAISGYDTVYHF